MERHEFLIRLLLLVRWRRRRQVLVTRDLSRVALWSVPVVGFHSLGGACAMASLSPRTAPIPFVLRAPRNSTILPAHTHSASLASQKSRPKSATGCAATLLCEQQHQPGVFRRSAPPGIRSFGPVSIMQPSVSTTREYRLRAGTQPLSKMHLPRQAVSCVLCSVHRRSHLNEDH